MTNSEVNGKAEIVLGICTVNKFPAQFITFLMETIQSKIFNSYCVIHSALLPFARNQILKVVYSNSPDFTHLMFIDADMTQFTGAHVFRLLEAEKDIISGVCTHRQPPYSLVSDLKDFPDVTSDQVIEFISEKQVVQSNAVGMAFTLIKRHVLDEMREETPAGPIWFTTDRGEREGFAVEVERYIQSELEENSQAYEGYTDGQVELVMERAIAFGQNSHIGANLTGEDFAFCSMATKLGFTCWSDFGCVIGHLAEQAITLADTLKQPEIITS